MRKIFRFFPWVALLLATLACTGGNLGTVVSSKFETGEISFVSPIDGAELHTDGTGGDPPQILVSIRSTFDTDKVVRLGTQFGQVECLALANQVTPCGSVPYLEGLNTFTAEIFKVDGKTVVSAQVSFTWVPYTAIDKAVARLTGNAGGDPTASYLLVGFALALVVSLVLGLKTGEKGAAIGFFLTLLAVAAFTALTAPTISLAILEGIFGFIVAGLILAGLYFWLKSGQTVTAPQFEKAWVKTPDGHEFGAERSHWGQVGPGEYAPQSGHLSTNLIEGARKAGIKDIPPKISYDTPLKLEDKNK